ncbi:acyl-coenzyme A synthetase ACSM3, mitochondrial, partial [Fukomys damarensis]|uniref:acyl-coenzyme A synthetase ACSM3, mitochondrial n=1 Tax=Fukomys damarensis TaxID=885580 RepID=UPI001455BD33
MEILRARCFQCLAIHSFMRPLHRDYRAATPQNFSSYESMKKDFKLEIPEYFNFAEDVLDQWTNVEKVGKRPSNPAFWWINGNGEEGDPVIVILPKIPEWWLANVACLRT